MKSEGEERIGHVSEELFEESGELDWVLVREVDRRRIPVERVAHVLETTDVSVLPEDSLHRHVCKEKEEVGQYLSKRERRKEKKMLTHLLHSSDDVLDESWNLEMSVRRSQDRIRSSTLDELVQRNGEDPYGVEKIEWK